MITTTEKPTTQIPPAAKEAELLRQDIAALTVVDPQTYSLAAAYLQRIKGIKKNLDDFFDAGIQKAFQLHKTLVAQKRTFTDPLDRDERVLKGQMGEYHRVEEQKRLKAQREAEAAQRKADEDRRLAEAVDLENKGRQAEAERVLTRPAAVAPVIVPTVVPKVEGISTSYRYSAQVNDHMALYRAVVEGVVPMEAIQPNEKVLNNQARVLKEALNYPGVTVLKEPVVSSRAG